MNHTIYPKQSESILTIDCKSEILSWQVCGGRMRGEGFSYTVVKDRVDSVYRFLKLIADIPKQ